MSTLAQLAANEIAKIDRILAVMEQIAFALAARLAAEEARQARYRAMLARGRN